MKKGSNATDSIMQTIEWTGESLRRREIKKRKKKPPSYSPGGGRINPRFDDGDRVCKKEMKRI